MTTPGEPGIPYGGGGGKRDSYMRSLAAAQKREQQALHAFLDQQAKNKQILVQKTWEAQFGSCTNPGQKAIMQSFSAEWFNKYSRTAYFGSYEEYLDLWGKKANSMSISAATISALTTQLSIGYATSVSLGYALLGDQSGRNLEQVYSTLEYIESFLGALSARKPAYLTRVRYRSVPSVWESLGWRQTFAASFNPYWEYRSGLRGIDYDKNIGRRGSAFNRYGREYGTRSRYGVAGRTAAPEISVGRRLGRLALRYGRFII